MNNSFKKVFVCIFTLFLICCTSSGCASKTITLPNAIKNISSAKYLGEGIYALNISKDKSNENYKLINSKGELITKQTIIYIQPGISFSKEGSILVSISKSMYEIEHKLINKNGAVISKDYDGLLYLGKGVYFVNKDFTFGYCNSTGKEIAKLIHGLKFCDFIDPNFLPYKSENGKYGFLNSQGKTIVPFIFDDVTTSIESSDLVPVCKNNKWGFIDKKGNLLIPYKFDEASVFKNSTSIVMIKDKYGVIDKTGDLIIPYKFDFIVQLKSGLYRVRLGDKRATIDNKGNYFIKPQPFIMDLVHPGYLDDKNMILLGNNNFNLTDKDGNILTDDKYDYINYYKDDLFRVKRNDKYGFINRQGKVVIPAKFNNFLEFKDSLCIVNLNGKYGVLDINNTYKIQPKYNEIRYIFKNYFAVKLNDKWGIVDINKKIVKPIEYDDIASIDCNDSKIQCKYNVILKKNNKALFLKIKE